MTKAKKFLKGAGIFLLVLMGLILGILLFFTLREYRPKPTEAVKTPSGKELLSTESTLRILTCNTGYGGLDASEDFFMDGGTRVQPDNQKQVEKNLHGIGEFLSEANADVYFLQEVDLDSKRSFHINQRDFYEEALGMDSAFGRNFLCDFVPYPLPPIGKVDSGILTLTSLQTSSSSRISLPESFSWPVKTCNLKRCMLETRVPLEGTDAELVLLNFHLEAYDSGEGKLAQSKMLAEKLEEEYAAGNYVIAGGDFNQTFPDMEASYPLIDTENWAPGTLEEDSLPEHFSFAVDDSYPTCRLLNQPYTGSYDTSQVYVIDGFIVSDNLEVTEIKVLNKDFQYTDHQPVQLEVSFLP